MSDAEDELQFESLIATRARRSNAGSRLKQLLELEEQSNEITTTRNQFVTEDDENVDLLFQEDGDDEEFIDEDVDNANLEGIDEDSDEDDEDGKNYRRNENVMKMKKAMMKLKKREHTSIQMKYYLIQIFQNPIQMRGKGGVD